MGIHGNSTCVMNYDSATGWLIGEENKGMQAMFVMMNEARLGVAVQGLAQSEVAYQNAVAYARDRLQGRALTGPKAPDKPADPIIVHPDVRRTLLTIRAFNEAARAMVVWTALKSDVAHRSSDPKERQAADDHMGLMTPVLKGFLTDIGFDNAVQAQQMFGGHGYIAEQGMEQFVRDARIAMIYEGANGIQALDLVGRKLPRDGGRAIMAFFAELGAYCKEHGGDEAMKPYVAPVAAALGHLQQATVWLMQNAMKKPDNAGAAATDYMQLFGLVTLGYMWARMAKVALDKIAGDWRDRLSEDQARDRPLLHGADAAGDRRCTWRASRPAATPSWNWRRKRSERLSPFRRDPLSYDEHHLQESVMAEAFIYDHVRTPRGRGKADGALHEVTALALATVPLKALKDRNKLDPKTSSTTSCSAASIRSAKPAATSPASRR